MFVYIISARNRRKRMNVCRMNISFIDANLYNLHTCNELFGVAQFFKCFSGGRVFQLGIETDC